MKQLIFLSAFIALNSLTNAQQGLRIKQGDRLKYFVTVQGETFPMYVHIDLLDAGNFSMTWSFNSGRSGKFIMGRSSLDSATFGYWNQPIDGEELRLPATQNVLFLSRSVYSALQKNKEAMFDDYSVTVIPSVTGSIFQLKDRTIDALCLESESGVKIWVLNDPITPLILKIEGNPFGVDVELAEIN